MADIFATTAWQSAGTLTEDTTFGVKGSEAQFTASDTTPGSDLARGQIVPGGSVFTFPSGKTVWYRSAAAATASAGAANNLKVRISMEPGF